MDDFQVGKGGTDRFPVPGPSVPPAGGKEGKRRFDLCSDGDYLRGLCPFLHVGDADFCDAAREKLAGSITRGEWRRAFQRSGLSPGNSRGKEKNGENPFAAEGFFTLSGSESIPWPVDISLVARGIVTIVAAGLPPSFIGLYDEVYLMQLAVAEVMRPATGGCVPNLDVLAWCVDPCAGQAGFTPHRDRQPQNALDSFRGGRPDGEPRYATCWVALADAHPDNSCLYMLPSWCDPGYAAGDNDTAKGAPDPLTLALSAGKDAYQNIRALPLTRGGSVLFTSRVIHWGSRGRGGQRFGPRLSIAFPFSDPEYEEPYLRERGVEIPDLPLRHALLCGQMVVYHERYDLTARELRLFRDGFNAQRSKFEPSYAAKVDAEFGAGIGETVMAKNDGGKGAKKIDGQQQQQEDQEEESSDEEFSRDIEDEALEALLDAEENGAGVRDDFSDGEWFGDSSESDEGEDDADERPASGKSKKRTRDVMRAITSGEEVPEESSGSGERVERPAWFKPGKETKKKRGKR